MRKIKNKYYITKRKDSLTPTQWKNFPSTGLDAVARKGTRVPPCTSKTLSDFQVKFTAQRLTHLYVHVNSKLTDFIFISTDNSKWNTSFLNDKKKLVFQNCVHYLRNKVLFVHNSTNTIRIFVPQTLVQGSPR
jgi:hypothetical protein